jgi:hypothetical protein
LAYVDSHWTTAKQDNGEPWPGICNASAPINSSIADSDKPTLVNYGSVYTVNSTDLDKIPVSRMGWAYGGLLIPYKFEFRDRSFQGSPSTVGYVGYEGWITGLSFTGVLALGPGVASSSNTTTTQSGSGTASTSTSSSTNLTYTIATGGIFTFGKSIKAGLLIGRDYKGGGSGFKYENGTWMALSVGTGFN